VRTIELEVYMILIIDLFLRFIDIIYCLNIMKGKKYLINFFNIAKK